MVTFHAKIVLRLIKDYSMQLVIRHSKYQVRVGVRPLDRIGNKSGLVLKSKLVIDLGLGSGFW